MTGRGAVFVSHTSDMAGFPPGRSFVQAAVEAVSKAGFLPVDMSQFTAREDAPAEYCREQVRACDVYLAVVGFRYGSRVPDRADGISYTDLEFLAATEGGIPRLVFMLGEDVAIPRSLLDKDSGAVDAFRERLRRAGVTVKVVGTPAELGEAVLQALYELQRAGAAIGSTPRNQGAATADLGATGGRRPWMAPPVDRVVERPKLGRRLLAALEAPGPGEVGRTTALQGAGGFGKTQLAAEYAHRHAAVYRLVWWVTAETPTQAAAGLGALADALGLPPGEPAQRQVRLWAVLAGRGDWLLVYDKRVPSAQPGARGRVPGRRRVGVAFGEVEKG